MKYCHRCKKTIEEGTKWKTMCSNCHRQAYTEVEDAAILNKDGDETWAQVAERLNTGRTPLELAARKYRLTTTKEDAHRPGCCWETEKLTNDQLRERIDAIYAGETWPLEEHCERNPPTEHILASLYEACMLRASGRNRRASDEAMRGLSEAVRGNGSASHDMQ